MSSDEELDREIAEHASTLKRLYAERRQRRAQHVIDARAAREAERQRRVEMYWAHYWSTQTNTARRAAGLPALRLERTLRLPPDPPWGLGVSLEAKVLGTYRSPTMYFFSGFHPYL